MKKIILYISLVLFGFIACRKRQVPIHSSKLDFETILKSGKWYMAEKGTKYNTYDPDANVPVEDHMMMCDSAYVYTFLNDSTVITTGNDTCKTNSDYKCTWVYNKEDSLLRFTFRLNGVLQFGYGYFVKDYTEKEIHFYITAHAIEDTTYRVDLVTYRAK